MLLVLIAFLAQAAAAPVAGVVVDARTRQPIAGALVELGNPPQSILTDAEGRFRFDGVAVGPVEIVVSLVGYSLAKYDITLASEGADVTIALNEGTAAFNESVLVQGSLFGARETGVAAQQTLGSAELRQLGGMTLDDPLRAVQALAGVTANDDFYGELAVRGNGFRQLNYTLDGVPAKFFVHTLELVSDGGSISMINSDVIDRASLLRGAYAQRFDQRVGAALEFASSEGSRERARYNLTASGTSASATADGPLGSSRRGSWIVSARRSYLDLFLKRVLQDSSQAFGFEDVFSKVVYDVSDRDQFQASMLLGRSLYDTDVPDGPEDLKRAAHAAWMGTATWRQTLSPRFTVTHRAFMTGESYDNRNAANVTVGTGRASDSGYRMDLGYTPREGQLLEGGWSLERLGTRQQQAFAVPGWPILGGEDFRAAASKLGAYAQLHWTRGAVTVTPGARVDRFGLTGDWAISPWLQAEWQASNNLTVSANTGLHHQFPEFVEVAGRRGRPELRPEQSFPVDVGVERRIGMTMRLQITGYHREERDLVDLPGQYTRVVGGTLRPPSATSLYDNSLEGSSRGVEVLLQRRTPALSGWIAYSLARTRYTDRVTGATFDGDFDQRHTVSVFGRYRISERMSVNTRWRYGSNRPIAGFIEQRANGLFFVSATRNAARVPAYSRLDVRVDRTYDWGSRRVTLFGEVANLLNRENFRQNPPGIDFRSGRAFGPLQPMFPIVPSIGATLEF